LKLKYLSLFLVILIFFISACSNANTPTGNVILEPEKSVCNKPYFEFKNNECCLDKDDNSICDKDEQTVETLEVKETLKPEPEIETKEEETKFLTIEDLQADMGNVIRETLVLTKDPEIGSALIYSNKIINTKFLGKYGIKQYSKVITKKPQIVIQITNKDDYLEENIDFQNFVTENKNLFIETALKSKEIFENAFEEDLPKLIYLKLDQNAISQSKRATYVNHSQTSSVLFYDNITFPETVSENVAELIYIKVNKYDVTVNHPSKWGTKGYTEKLSNINYGQSIVVKCSPNLVIGLSYEDYGGYSTAKYERDYDKLGIDSSYFKTSLRDHYQDLIKDSQALVKMCEQRYQFTYVRER